MRFSILAPLALAACASTSPEDVPNVRVATAGEVVGCQRVGTMRGIPGVYGIFAEQGVRDARRVVLEGTEDMGANTVVFEPIEPGVPVTEVVAATYLC